MTKHNRKIINNKNKVQLKKEKAILQTNLDKMMNKFRNYKKIILNKYSLTEIKIYYKILIKQIIINHNFKMMMKNKFSN